MAIPFGLPLPSDARTYEQYHRIHQLLLDLIAVLRTLVARNPEWVQPIGLNANAAANNNANPAAVPPPLPAFNPATPQFGLPLSPPNSQPASPSPFFTATAASASAFVLPDVVANAARTLGELGPTQAAPPTIRHHISAANVQREESQPVGPSRRLRKRKRARLSKKRSLSEMRMELGHAGVVTCERQQHCKLAKTTDSSTCSCFCNAAVIATADDRVDSALQQPSASCCADVPRVLGAECCCGQQLPSDCKVPVCVHVGEELRKIVECFRNPKQINESNIDTDGEIADVKGSGFLSQFGRTMFTAALLVIGWKLLKHN